jgi:hypothetical protein
MTPTPTPFGQYELSLAGAPRNLRIGVVTTEIYVIKLQNIRPTSVTNVVITHTVPFGLEVLQSQPPPTTENGNVLTYTFPKLDPFSTTQILVQANLRSNTAAGTALTSTVAVRDQQGNNVEALFAGGVRSGPTGTPGNLKVVLTTVKQVLAGSSLKSTLTINNTGSLDATDVTVALLGPQSLQFSSAIPAPTSVQTANGQTTITWNLGKIAGPGNSVIKLTQRVAADVAPGTILKMTAIAAAPDGRTGEATKSVTVRN